MELNKQLKLINRKFAYNTGKLPGFLYGLAAEKQAGYPTYDPMYRTQLTAMEEKVSNDWLNALKNTEAEIGAWRDSQKAPEPVFKSEVDRMRSYLKPGESLIGSHFDNAIQQGSGYTSDDPYTKNPNLEPPQKISKQLNIGNIQTGLGGVGQLAAGITESFNAKSKDEFLAEYKPVQRTVAGRAYTALAKAKDGKLPGYAPGKLGSIANSAIGGATAGSIAGPWGTVFGGAGGFLGGVAGALISGKKEEENERTISDWVKQYNNGERGNTISQIMGEDNQGLYGNLYAQSLIHHANGKLPGFKYGLPNFSFTERGLVYGLEPNAMGAPGETLGNNKGDMYVLPGTPKDEDVLPIHTFDDTTVVTNKKGLSKYVQRTGDLAGALAAMAYYMKNGYKNGKVPGYKEGWLGNGIPALFGTVAGLGQYLDAIHNTPYHPRTYAANPYETTALNTLAGLRINPYPIARQLRDAEARSNRAIDMAGGLSGSQRTAARLANLNTTQGNISNLLSSIQQQNNAYRANYAQAALDAGNKSRAARMSANQWDLDYYSKAHAARNKGMQTGIANMLAQSQQYIANEFKRNQFNRTMSLYDADQKLRNDQLNWYKDNAAKLANIGSMFNMPSLYRSKPLYYKDENGNYIEIPA